MENAGAHNLIKAGIQLVHAFDGQLLHMKIFQIMLALEFLGTKHTRPLMSMPVTCAPGQRIACFAA